MNDCGAKSKLSGPLIISQKPGTTVYTMRTKPINAVIYKSRICQ
jgi:hypothetical protein